MDDTEAVTVLAALAQPTRLQAFRRLVEHEPDGIAAGELARLLAVPQNTLSAHLSVLANAGLVSGSRHSRSIVYRPNLDRMSSLTLHLLQDCCGGRPELCAPVVETLTPAARPEPQMPADRPYNVLFLCTGNTARSILAEGILRGLGAGRFNAFSAGSQPKGIVNPLALAVLAAEGLPSDGYRSKSWDEFALPDAPVFDFVFTVCDNAAGEACPVWPGRPTTAHWGVEDPAAVEGTEIERRRAFLTAYRYLRNRIEAFVALPIASLDGMSLAKRLTEIGRLEGATARAGGTA